VQHGLPGPFPEEVLAQARESLDTFDPDGGTRDPLDMSDEIICTIDPDDAKDYDDAISLRRRDDKRLLGARRPHRRCLVLRPGGFSAG
jgi:ribonuclease R